MSTNRTINDDSRAGMQKPARSKGVRGHWRSLFRASLCIVPTISTIDITAGIEHSNQLEVIFGGFLGVQKRLFDVLRWVFGHRGLFLSQTHE